MKTIRLPLLALFGLAMVGALRADNTSAASRVDVTFVNPDKFTDVKDAYMPTDSGQKGILDDLQDYIVHHAGSRLSDGQHLSVKVTDIDLAGDFEPWHGPEAQDIRIMKAIYTPKIDLSFTLTDASGNVVKQGERHLRDLNYTMNINSVNRSDPRFYDKALLDDWIRNEFPHSKKK